MITQELVVEKIMTHLNHTLTETELVQWAETAFVTLSESDTDIPNETLLLDILTYLAAGDSAGFPLSWPVLSGFLAQLGVTVRVVAGVA
ncbi:MAG: hypothetical protein K8S97_00105 [Anaerolineae bacterium]|nr:hypothetical protein [Anaerolineae bacterium]